MIKSKKILRFYFNADGLERTLDKFILAAACRSAGTYAAEECANGIIELIAAKDKLAELWERVDGIIGGLSAGERQTLESYAFLRCGIRRLEEARQREIRRAVIKFTRHARGIERYADALKLVGEYYCFL